jgi:uncharacterized membrane protein
VIELLALASAVLYGTGDFFGGLTARRVNAVAAVAVSQFAGLVLLAAMIAFLPGVPSSRDLLWGVSAGLTGGAGVALLYRALAVGTMAVVAPTTAVCAVVVPVLAAFAMGERLKAITAAGIGLAIVGIFLVSQQERPEHAADLRTTMRTVPPGIGIAVWSGVAIGLFFLSLARTTGQGGLWPLLFARVTSVLLFVAIAVVTSRPLGMPAGVLKLAVGGGIFDMLANALYVVAARSGPLSVVVTLASLYPASTVVLAHVVLGERLSPMQKAGIFCTLTAVVVIVGTAR